jgi:hypothetical protein
MPDQGRPGSPSNPASTGNGSYRRRLSGMAPWSHANRHGRQQLPHDPERPGASAPFRTIQQMRRGRASHALPASRHWQLLKPRQTPTPATPGTRCGVLCGSLRRASWRYRFESHANGTSLRLIDMHQRAVCLDRFCRWRPARGVARVDRARSLKGDAQPRLTIAIRHRGGGAQFKSPAARKFCYHKYSLLRL